MRRLFAVLYNLDIINNSNEALVIGPFDHMHTACTGQFELITYGFAEPLMIYTDATEHFVYGNAVDTEPVRYTDMALVVDFNELHWQEYQIVQVSRLG